MQDNGAAVVCGECVKAAILFFGATQFTCKSHYFRLELTSSILFVFFPRVIMCVCVCVCAYEFKRIPPSDLYIILQTVKSLVIFGQYWPGLPRKKNRKRLASVRVNFQEEKYS